MKSEITQRLRCSLISIAIFVPSSYLANYLFNTNNFCSNWFLLKGIFAFLILAITCFFAIASVAVWFIDID